MTEPMFPPNRRQAVNRLHEFAAGAGRQYRAERNFDFGPGRHQSVSGLSPYIRHRALAETEVLSVVLQHHAYSSAEKFIQEVYWRTYWKGWLEHRPGVWTRYLDDVAQALRRLDADRALRSTYEAAISGSTGIETYDAWAQELTRTGYLHNHARMWFASIWIFTLELPWVLGADFFLRHLLDGDPASNTLSWRWVAGLHTRGKTYLATADNIEKYAGERFFVNGNPPAGLERLACRAVALTEAPLPPAVMPELPGAPAPGARTALLLTEEDLLLEAPFAPSAVAVWLPNAATPLPCSASVQQFKTLLAEDTLHQVNTRWPDAAVAPLLSSVRAVVDWARQQQCKRLLMPYAPQGHVRPQVAPLQDALGSIGCELVTFVRDYDRLAWPHASNGFFQLKKHIPEMLQTLQI